jgi:hypothetical protein
MQVFHAPAALWAVFDDPNLVPYGVGSSGGAGYSSWVPPPA